MKYCERLRARAQSSNSKNGILRIPKSWMTLRSRKASKAMKSSNNLEICVWIVLYLEAEDQLTRLKHTMPDSMARSDDSEYE